MHITLNQSRKLPENDGFGSAPLSQKTLLGFDVENKPRFVGHHAK